MNVNLNRPFLDATKKAVKDSEGKEVLVSERICVMLYNLSNRGGKPATADEKYKAYRLMCRIQDNPEAVQVDAAEAGLIRELCAEQLSAGAYGQVAELLDE